MRGVARQQKVAVVVPMYNAEGTIRDTLASISKQTWRALDIVVVDDGSTDRSADAVAESARCDPRIHLVCQPNAGVAAARNSGAAHSDADILTFVDADDLWAPDKIAAQMNLLLQRGGAPALVYCWFVQIDARGRIYSATDGPAIEGKVLRQICRANFIGNCSSILVPREVFGQIGGFDSSLKASDAQGCEDLLFFARAAQNYEFRLVPRHLLGYRLTHANMSSNTAAMLRSFDVVAARLREELPQYATEWLEHRRDFILWLIRRAAMAGRLAAVFELADLWHGKDRIAALSAIPELVRIYTKSRLVPPWVKAAAEHAGLKPARARYLDLPW